MIVADADLVAYFWIEQVRSDAARQVRRRDPAWVVPPLWRAELRAILRRHLASGLMTPEEARGFFEKAAEDLRGAEHDAPDLAVLYLICETGHPAFECEYVALAESLGIPLVTGDRALVKRFPQTAVVMEDFAGGG